MLSRSREKSRGPTQPSTTTDSGEEREEEEEQQDESEEEVERSQEDENLGDEARDRQERRLAYRKLITEVNGISNFSQFFFLEL